jgi:hypothetical protein
MAEEPWDWLLMTDAEELYARSRARMEVTERLIKQSREVLESSRALLDRTRPISPTDPWPPGSWPPNLGLSLVHRLRRSAVIVFR